MDKFFLGTNKRDFLGISSVPKFSVKTRNLQGFYRNNNVLDFLERISPGGLYRRSFQGRQYQEDSIKKCSSR